jgi:hypothetical protein
MKKKKIIPIKQTSSSNGNDIDNEFFPEAARYRIVANSIKNNEYISNPAIFEKISFLIIIPSHLIQPGIP